MSTQNKCYLHPKAIESAGRGVSSCQANTKIQKHKNTKIQIQKHKNIKIQIQKYKITNTKYKLQPLAPKRNVNFIQRQQNQPAVVLVAAWQITNIDIQIQNTKNKLTQKICHLHPKAIESTGCSVSTAAKQKLNTQDTQSKCYLHPYLQGGD